MANHLTPEELSKELGIDRQEVIRLCVEEGVPIYQGKIDKTLFQAQLEALGAMPQKHSRARQRARGAAARCPPPRPRRPAAGGCFFFFLPGVLGPRSASIRSTTGA